MKKFIETILIIIVLLFGLALYLLSNHLGGWRAFVVQSGSMEPTIPTGSLIITHQVRPYSLRKGDVITFIAPIKNKEFITHRIDKVLKHGTELTTFKTKGDKNNSEDSWILAGGGVVGKTVYSVPYLGYLLSFTKTKIGIAIFILIPAFIIIYMEITSIMKLLKTRKARTTIATDGQMLVVLLLVIPTLSSGQIRPTSALLSDTASLTGNKFTLVSNQHDSDCGGVTKIDIINNGVGSTSNVNLFTNCTATITQNNTTAIKNTLNSDASTGGNQTSGNTSGINSGSATTNTNIINRGSVNISN